MRGTTHNQFWLLEDDELFIGISLGADHCAEHEWGITPLEEMLGIWRGTGRFGERRDAETGPAGIQRRTVGSSHNMEEDLFTFAADDNYAVFICHQPCDWYEKDYSKLSKMVKKGEGLFHACAPKRDWSARTSLKGLSPIAEDWEFSSAWDDSGFVLLTTKKHESRVRALYEAALRKDFAVWIGGTGNPFANGGLTLAIVSKISHKHLDEMKEADEGAARLRKLFRESGIEQRLKEADKKYYACSPRLVAKVGEFQTKYEIVCWLNPQDQEDNHYGWYTIEELDLWVEGKGPVIEMAEEKKKTKKKTI